MAGYGKKSKTEKKLAKKNQQPIKGKHILFIDNGIDRIGGVERVVCALSNYLVPDNTITVISKDKTSKEPFFNYDDRVKRVYLRNRLDDSIITSIKIKIKRLFTLKHSFIKQIKADVEPDVVVFGRISAALLFLPPLIKTFGKKPKIIVRDAAHYWFLNERERRCVKKLFPEYVDVMIVSSSESISKYEEVFGDNSVMMKKIYNPIGISPNYGYDLRSKTVVSIGRMDDNQKGFDNLIKSFVYVHKKHPDWRLVLYGEGKEKGYYEKLIHSFDANSYIFIEKPTKDVVKTFNKSSIFVLASRFEGYANILVEALSCGIPSVSYDWMMGVEEIITDGENGVVVPLKDRLAYNNGLSAEDDCMALAEGICKLIENPDLMKSISKKSPDIIKSRRMEVVVQQWEELLRDKN